MAPTDIARAFKRKVNGEVSVEPSGIDRFVVYTPFQFDDGDHYVVVLKREQGKWLLTDEGHTFMHLSYEDVDLATETRAQLIDQALSTYHVENDGGELKLVIPGTSYGDALFSFVQALGRIAHTASWTQERVKHAFRDDLEKVVYTSVPLGKVHVSYSDPEIDPNGHYKIDYMIEGRDRQWYLFGIANDTQCLEATITCLHYEKHKRRFGSIAIHEDMTRIAKRPLAQLTDVVNRQFSSLTEKDRITRYFQEEIVGNGHGPARNIVERA